MMPNQFDPERAAKDVEDRRSEWSAWQKLLMAIGVEPIDRVTPTGYEPGHYNAEQYFAENPVPVKPSPLGVDAGLLSLKDPETKTINQLLKKYPPMKEK